MTEFLLQCLTALLYVGLGICWRARHRAEAAAGGARGSHLAAAAPILLHGGLLYAGLVRPDGLNLTLATALSACVWLSVIIFWFGNFRRELDGMQPFVYPVAAIVQFLPLAPSARHPLVHAGPLLGAHLLVSLLAYGLLTLAALHALLMAAAEARLRHDANSPLLRGLPPLLTMERLLFRIVACGFALLTLSLVSGMLFSEKLFGRALAFNHKTVFAVASWLLYAGLLIGRRACGWRGRTAVRLTLAGFVALVLAWFGTQFVLVYLLHRG